MDSNVPPPPPPPPPPFSAPVPPAPAPTPGQRNWWQRNWKWFVPTGCCLTPMVLFAAFAAVMVFVVGAALKSSDVYKTALARAKADPRVIEAIGRPISEPWFLTGNAKTSGGSGEADLAIPISGPKGKAKIYAVATKSAGEWSYSKLIVEVANGGERIDLNEETPKR